MTTTFLSHWADEIVLYIRIACDHHHAPSYLTKGQRGAFAPGFGHLLYEDAL